MAKTLTFKLARVAHGQRNLIESSEEAELQYRAKQMREVLLPGVDAATAWAMCQQAPIVGLAIHAVKLRNVLPEQCTDPTDAAALQAAADLGIAQRGFAVFIPEKWAGLHHLVRYFDLIEKNEAPDTPLLEWLLTAGAVASELARTTVRRFTKKVTFGRHVFKLDKVDAERLTVAAEVRQQLEAEDAAARRLG